MKTNVILSFIIATAVIITVSAISVSAKNTENEEILTSDILKEFILSGANKRDIQAVETLSPSMSGEITFSEPFKLPFYNIETNKSITIPNLWCSAIFVNEKIIAIATFSYSAKQVVWGAILYLPYDFCTQINNGSEYSMFLIDTGGINGEDNGSLQYAINSDGKNIFLMHDTYTNMKSINPYDLKTDKTDYCNLSAYNSISNNMAKAVTVEYKDKDGLSDGSVVTFINVSGGNFTYNGTSRFIIHECGIDNNGEMTYSLHPENKPKSRIKISGSTKLYIRCAEGGEKPTYKICSAQNPNKVIFIADNGKTKIQNWSNNDNQQWIIYLK